MSEIIQLIVTKITKDSVAIISLIKMTTGILISLKIDLCIHWFFFNDLAVFGCVIDKQYDSLSGLMISFGTASFGTAKDQLIFYRHIETQNILMRQSTVDTGHSWTVQGGGGGWGKYSVISFNLDISQV